MAKIEKDPKKKIDYKVTEKGEKTFSVKTDSTKTNEKSKISQKPKTNDRPKISDKSKLDEKTDPSSSKTKSNAGPKSNSSKKIENKKKVDNSKTDKKLSDDKIDKKEVKSRKENIKNWWSKNWRKRWFKVTVIIGLILTLFLIIFLPILFTVILKDPAIECGVAKIPGSEPIDLCAPEDVKATEYDKYKDKAIIWMYETKEEELINLGIDDPQKLLDDTRDSVNTTIDNEKESYKSEYGSEWESQWETDLEAQGFNNENEYKDSLIAERLMNNSFVTEFEWSQSIYNNFNDLIATIPAEGINGNTNGDAEAALLQVSSIPTDGLAYADSTSRFVALDPIMYTNIAINDEGNIEINTAEGNSPIKYYVEEYKPINVSHILFGWTYTNSSPIDSVDNITGDQLVIEQVALENLIKFSIIIDDWVNGSVNVDTFNFSNLATDYSTDDGSAANGGSLGVVSAKSTGYVEEFNYAIYLMLSDLDQVTSPPDWVNEAIGIIGGSTTPGDEVAFGSIFTKFIENINNAINSASYIGDFWGVGEDWDTFNEIQLIDDFFNDYVIEGNDKEQIESTLFNEFLTNSSMAIIHSRLSSSAFNLPTEGYDIYDPSDIGDHFDYSIQTAAPYSLVPSRYGLHILRIDQLAASEIYTGTPDPSRSNDSSSGGSVVTTVEQDTHILNEIGYRMIRTDLTDVSDRNKDTVTYNIQDSYNQFIATELENWVWNWAYASSFDSNGNVRNDPDAFINWAGDDVDQAEMERIQEEAEAIEIAEDISSMLAITNDIEEYYEENVFVDDTLTKLPAFSYNDLSLIKDWIIYVSQDILEISFPITTNSLII